jgi:hypothetical protein
MKLMLMQIRLFTISNVRGNQNIQVHPRYPYPCNGSTNQKLNHGAIWEQIIHSMKTTKRDDRCISTARACIWGRRTLIDRNTDRARYVAPARARAFDGTGMTVSGTGLLNPAAKYFFATNTSLTFRLTDKLLNPTAKCNGHYWEFIIPKWILVYSLRFKLLVTDNFLSRCFTIRLIQKIDTSMQNVKLCILNIFPSMMKQVTNKTNYICIFLIRWMVKCCDQKSIVITNLKWVSTYYTKLLSHYPSYS